MVRNIPKACTRERFVELLAQFGLGESYTFFYMPYDKNRNIHCGFAFVNFRIPIDVLRLYEGLQTANLRTNSNTAPPAVSYARLQGQEQLMQHFSLSAVMYDSDARKRPVFVAAGASSGSSESDQNQEIPKKAAANTNEGAGTKASANTNAYANSNTNNHNSQGLDRLPAKMTLQKPSDPRQPRYIFSEALKEMNFPPGLGPAAQLDQETMNFLLSSAVGA
jgi:RNA recognition motif-containing protein